ncbi:PREDICTED: uncharacterized protein LOC109227695 [Nicotiana attenuata]|uniref:uncharacterized protein LOC109227695 n=1 Tax=Nicotiana attenuata TaxID=49451 RepID=UPI0009046362|nr:PREDICTED: uncharacterized protein LOC109227695 [Nicotiana attenuata]
MFLLSNEYNVVNLYAVDECDPPIECIPSIVDNSESYPCLDEAGADCCLSELGSDSSSDSEGWVTVKTLESEHNCGTAYDNSTVDFNTIAHYFKGKLQDNPKYKCRRAKRMILETLDGSFADEYNKLDAYAIELRESNPGSDVVINISKNALENGKRRFLRIWHILKAKAKGQLLVAVGQDAQNHFYPLAWAVDDKETKHSSNWFLQLLQGSLNLKEGEGITFMSDMQKGLIEAIKIVLPQAHHRFCARHIEANCKPGELNKDAAESLLKYPPHSWCRAYLDTVCKNQSIDNNLTESFNSWILEARTKPIIKMLEDIRLKVMNMMIKHEVEASTWSNEFSPKSLELYNKFMEIAQVCKVNSNGEGGYEVSEGSNKHCVNLSIKKCTCRAWDLTGIPCPHAIRAILHNMGDHLTEMHWWYSKEAFLLTYRHKLQPVRGEKFWKIDPSKAMEPPELVNQVWPMVISEVKTRLQLTQQVNLPARRRSINFTDDHTGVSEPTDLPNSPAGLMWKGKAATTSNQLEKQRQ